ncbi:hypothetical protein [Luteimonas saliphila]|uniref:hypothetical protein n=1 Tax=Luteimonas saliphila TaxID=2804919 RepID=UPI00192D8A28|nr:hypothetical protein [Luteimonas saliphila]
MSVSECARRAPCAILAAVLLALAACGGGDRSGGDGDTSPTRSVADAGARAAPASDQDHAGASVAPPSARTPAAPAAASGFGSRELAHPEDLQMLLLGYRLQGREPPLAEWAAAQYAVVRANEFERGKVREQEQARLQAVYDGTEGVGLLRLNVRANLSEYDASRGGYYLDAFTPGSVFRFSARAAPPPFREETVSLRIDNPGELNFWPLDPSAAQEVLARNNGQRNVALDSRLRITGIRRRSTEAELTATLLGYAIVSSRYGQPGMLGERRFDDPDRE